MTRNQKTEAAPVVFEPEFNSWLADISEQRIVLQPGAGPEVVSRAARAGGDITCAPELVGALRPNRIHGGVISASLTRWRLAAMAAIGPATWMNRSSTACTALPNWAPSTCASIRPAPRHRRSVPSWAG